MSKELVRCYQCVFYKETSRFSGWCKDTRPDKNGKKKKAIRVDAVDYCDDAVKKETT